MTRDGGRQPESGESPPGKGTRADYYVMGSGLVRVPAARAHEIPRVISEHHKLEAERARVAYLPRGI